MKKSSGIALVKDKLFTAFMIAPTLAVVIFSAVFFLLSTALGQSQSGGAQVVFSCLTLLALAGSTTLAVVHKRSIVTALLSAIFSLCLICYLAILISNTTNIFNDSFFEAVMLALSLPISSYRALSVALFGGGADIACCVLTALIAGINIVSSVYIVKLRKSEP